MEFGLYPIQFADMIFGPEKPEKIVATGTLLDSGQAPNAFSFNPYTQYPIQHFPSVDHWRKGTLSASAPLGCDISRYHRIVAHQWSIEESI